jgi:hypothetical protein
LQQLVGHYDERELAFAILRRNGRQMQKLTINVKAIPK